MSFVLLSFLAFCSQVLPCAQATSSRLEIEAQLKDIERYKAAYKFDRAIRLATGCTQSAISAKLSHLAARCAQNASEMYRFRLEWNQALNIIHQALSTESVGYRFEDLLELAFERALIIFEAKGPIAASLALQDVRLMVETYNGTLSGFYFGRYEILQMTFFPHQNLAERATRLEQLLAHTVENNSPTQPFWILLTQARTSRRLAQWEESLKSLVQAKGVYDRNSSRLGFAILKYYFELLLVDTLRENPAHRQRDLQKISTILKSADLPSIYSELIQLWPAFTGPSLENAARRIPSLKERFGPGHFISEGLTYLEAALRQKY